MTNDDRLAAIRTRLEAATPGPWVVHRDGDSIASISLPDDGSFGGPLSVVKANVYSDPVVLDISDEDAEFIAAAPDDVQFLLNLVEELKAECHRLTSAWSHQMDRPEAE
jgi:hypothetical protein